MEPKPLKRGTNCIDWEKAKKLVARDRVIRAVNMFKPCNAIGPDGIYPVCLQIGFDLIIKYLIKENRCSIVMGHIPKP